MLPSMKTDLFNHVNLNGLRICTHIYLHKYISIYVYVYVDCWNFFLYLPYSLENLHARLTCQNTFNSSCKRIFFFKCWKLLGLYYIWFGAQMKFVCILLCVYVCLYEWLVLVYSLIKFAKVLDIYNKTIFELLFFSLSLNTFQKHVYLPQ